MTSNKNVYETKKAKESIIMKIKTRFNVPKTFFLKPNYVQLESTTKCNMKCKQCIRGPDENYDMSFELYKAIIDQISCDRFGTHHVDLTGVGEPICNPQIVSMVNYAKDKGFKVSFTSNFSLMDESKALELVKSGIDFFYISVDGSYKDLFEQIRVGSSFEGVMSNIKNLINIKEKLHSSTPALNFYVALSEDNMHDIQNIIELAEGLGISRVNFNRLVIPGVKYWENELPLLDLWKSLPESKLTIGRRAIPLKVYQPCVALKGCFITYDGKVLPCNRITQMIPRSEYDSYYLGDLNDEDLYDIWFSNSYRKFRINMIRGIRPEFCIYCTHAYQF
jgi:radical SAM protein with 4Fe4S-binding SPASM domain